MGTVSLKSIAREVGVAPSTVSRVLRNDARCYVSKAKKEAILQAARTQEYIPHAAARSLVLKRSFNIAFVLCDFSKLEESGPFTPKMVEGVHQVLTPAGYVLSFVTIPQRDPAALERVCSATRTYDGLIFPLGTVDEQAAGVLADSSMPFVIAGDNSSHLRSFARVFTDKNGGFSRVIGHLKELGHTDIAFLGQIRSALDMFFDGCREHSLTVRPESIRLFESRNYYELQMAAYLAAQPLLTGPHTAVVCSNDFTALGLCQRLRDAGLEPGKDMSVTGFDDVEELLDVPEENRFLTTVHKPREEMGEAAARLLLEKIADPGITAREEQLPCRLVVRTSTGRKP